MLLKNITMARISHASCLGVCAAAAGVIASVADCKTSRDSARLPLVAVIEITAFTLIQQASPVPKSVLLEDFKQPTKEHGPAAGRDTVLGYQDNEKIPLPGPVRLFEKGFWWQEFKIQVKLNAS